MDLLTALIVVSEKAANIARLLRQNDRLFKRLVEVKSEADANPRFQEDFKTLADVLIQETVKHDIGVQFPSLRERIQGEESNKFINQTTNEEIIVNVKDTKEGTVEMLSYVLDDDIETANLLANEVHRTVNIEDVKTSFPEQDFHIDIDDLGIWIDPIDGTNEYVRGGFEKKDGEFYLKGLRCVTVLIGVYDKQGQPVIGVVNQPFFEKDIDNGYQCHWGVYYKNMDNHISISSIRQSETPNKNSNIICVGSGENSCLLRILENSGYRLVITRGAGYKLLTIILGFADAYVLSKPTTFVWDTCAPHALLRSLGGDIVELKPVARKQKIALSYNDRKSRDNKNGIIAYRNNEVLDKLMELPWKMIDIF